MTKAQEDFNWARIRLHMVQDTMIKCILSGGYSVNRIKRLSALLIDLSEKTEGLNRAETAWINAGRPVA